MPNLLSSVVLSNKNAFNKMVDDLATDASTASSDDIVVFSHLRWEFVTQRPQHIIERLTKRNRRILFVEEPISHNVSQRGTARIISPSKNVTVLQPKVSPGNFSQLHDVIKKYSPKNFSSSPMVWFYSAAFVSILEYLDYSAVIYDCMDELSQFRGAPASLVSQEKQLLSIADVVFTGGKSLFESKKRLHPSVYCFPSSIDTTHFAKALSKHTKIPADIAKIKQPIVGFYGVIDERLDLQLIAEVAKLLPLVSFAMIGPVVKINEADLPVAKNIHYLGAKKYSQLPAYLKGFSVAFMPFALNKATEFISPTKTLEFMAAYKPIVSTPIYDVKRDYSKEVRIVESSSQMAAAITAYLNESSSARRHRVNLQNTVLSKTSWDETVESMELLLGNIALVAPTERESINDFSLNISY